MHRTPLDRFLPAVFSLGVAIGANTVGYAQVGPPGLSSGSGAGTGTGASSGVQRSQSGSVSGVGPGSSGLDSGVPGRFPFRRIPPRFSVPAGPGVGVTFPTDPGLIPYLRLDDSGGPTASKSPTFITEEMLKKAREIQTPNERSLAFQLIAKGAIYSSQLSLAHQALEEAAVNAVQEPTPLTHDLRIMGVINTFTLLTEAVLREGKTAALNVLPPGTNPEPLPRKLDAISAIRLGRLEWKRAAYLAQMIHNATHRTEALYRLVDNQAAASIIIGSEYGNPDSSPSTIDEVRPAPAGDPDVYRKLADEILVDAMEISHQIERPIWKGKALVRISVGAADALLFERGLAVARTIDDPEYRTEALLFIAESQCRYADASKRTEVGQQATLVYTEAAKAVSEIRQMGLRGVCNGFLVDSLISVGRFDDARACVSLYPERYQQFVALGAIAESQARRGSAEAARGWIAREVPENYRPTLYRRVTRGQLDAIEQNRTQESLKNDLGNF